VSSTSRMHRDRVRYVTRKGSKLLGLISPPRQGLIPTTYPVSGITFLVTRDFWTRSKPEAASRFVSGHHLAVTQRVDRREQVLGGNVPSAQE
jgi:hypothetical protein